MRVAKLLVIGSLSGSHAAFVKSISEVKVRSSARTPTGDGFIPLDFGRVKVDTDLDLQLFGVGRDQVGVIADAIAPGIVGAILLLDKEDLNDSFFSDQAFDELAAREIPTVVGLVGDIDPSEVEGRLSLPHGAEMIECSPDHRDSVKSTIIRLLERRLKEESPAA